MKNQTKSGGVSSTPSMRGTICYIAPEYGFGGLYQRSVMCIALVFFFLLWFLGIDLCK